MGGRACLPSAEVPQPQVTSSWMFLLPDESWSHVHFLRPTNQRHEIALHADRATKKPLTPHSEIPLAGGQCVLGGCGGSAAVEPIRVTRWPASVFTPPRMEYKGGFLYPPKRQKKATDTYHSEAVALRMSTVSFPLTT